MDSYTIMEHKKNMWNKILGRLRLSIFKGKITQGDL